MCEQAARRNRHICTGEEPFDLGPVVCVAGTHLRLCPSSAHVNQCVCAPGTGPTQIRPVEASCLSKLRRRSGLLCNGCMTAPSPISDNIDETFTPERLNAMSM